MNSWIIVLERLILAFLLGGAVGVEREIRNQPAGFRTHAILAIGSALLMIISIKGAHIYGAKTSDPMRIAAQVVSGIGFLGAGAILRIGVSIKGLTTAASLWTTAAIGLACGAGFYWPAVLATALVLFALFLLGKMEKLYLFTKPKRSLFIEASDVPTLVGDLEKTLDSFGYNMDFVNVDRDTDKDKVEVQMVIRPKPLVPVEEDIGKVVSALLDLREVANVELK